MVMALHIYIHIHYSRNGIASQFSDICLYLCSRMYDDGEEEEEQI